MFPHALGLFAVSDVLQDRMELIQFCLLVRVGCGRQPAILAKNAKVERSNELWVRGDKGWSSRRWRQLLLVATQQDMTPSKNITSWMVFGFEARLLQISMADC